MVIIWGSGLYGKVDEVPQLFHVATSFVYLYYIPLIPLGSYVVFSQSGENFQGVRVGLSGKSILLAWLRTFLVVGAIAAAIAGAVTFPEDATQGVVYLVVAIAALGTFIFTKKAHGLSKASYARAVELAEYVGLSDEARLMIEVAYGQMTSEEAAARLAELHQAAQIPMTPVDPSTANPQASGA